MTGHYEDLNGKVAFVTGGASGIGLATSLMLAQNGVIVAVVDVQDDAGANAVETIEGEGGTATYIHCDVANAGQVEDAVASTVEKYGRLDIGVNNAGIGGTPAPTGEYPLEAWHQVIDINLHGVFYCMRYQIPEMLRNGGGSIINVASILGVVGWETAAAYVTAKHGMLGLTKSASLEYARQGIRVNAVCPAFIDTPLLRNAGIVAGTEFYDMIVGLHPVGRMGTSDEIAESITWLASAASSFVTGHPMLVDGGYTAR